MKARTALDLSQTKTFLHTPFHKHTSNTRGHMGENPLSWDLNTTAKLIHATFYQKASHVKRGLDAGEIVMWSSKISRKSEILILR